MIGEWKEMDDLKNIGDFRKRFGSCYADRKRVRGTVRMTVILEKKSSLGHVEESECRVTKLSGKRSVLDKMGLAGLWNCPQSENALSSIE